MFDFIWAFASTLLFKIYTSDNTLLFSNSIYSLLLLAGICCVLRYGKNRYSDDKRLFLLSHILGFLFAAMEAFGHALDVHETVFIPALIPAIALYTHVFAAGLVLLWRSLAALEARLEQPKENKLLNWLFANRWKLALILLICWIPAFMADFPGGFRYDADAEYAQWYDGYNGNFPLLHSVIITKLLFWSAVKLGSVNCGIAIYVVLQMLFMAALYSRIIWELRRRGLNSILLSVLLIYCALFPVIQILVVQEVRDILFAALMLYLVFLFYCMVTQPEEFFAERKNPVLTGIIIALAVLSRSNSTISALMLMLGCLLTVLLVGGKTHRRMSILTCASGIICFVLINSVCQAVCRPIQPSSAREWMTFVSQPLARVYTYEHDSMSQQEREEFEKYLNTESAYYCAENGDISKGKIDLRSGDILLFWLKKGVEYPGHYIDSVLVNTQNMWFPSSVIDGYNQDSSNPNGVYSNSEKCYYSIEGTLDRPAEHHSLLPGLLKYYEALGLHISFEKIPVLSMLFSIGFQFWGILNCVFYLVYRRRGELLLPTAIVGLYMLFSSFTPLVLLRYYSLVFFAVPLIAAFTVQPMRAAGKKL